jgi:hypothetical protein
MTQSYENLGPGSYLKDKNCNFMGRYNIKESFSKKGYGNGFISKTKRL